jgi:hypothetical protein
MKTKSMASTAKKSATAIFKQMWENTPKAIRRSAGSAVIVSMAAGLLAAPAMDEIGKQAVQDMAHELSYTWDPFAGDFA